MYAFAKHESFAMGILQGGMGGNAVSPHVSPLKGRQ
jgi:hypothetical protein